MPTPTGTPRKLGPLSLYGLAPVFNHFSFSNGQLEANVGLSASAAVLKFGSGSGNNPGGTTAILNNVAGSFQLAVGVDLHSFRVTSFGASGLFALTAGQFVLDVPHVVNVSAQNIAITYNPGADNTQKLISIGSAIITVPIGSGGQTGIQGSIASITDSNGNTIPGLAVYGDHFQLGRATIKYLGNLSLGGLVKFTNPFVSITDFSASFSGNIAFNGSISFGADGVTLGPPSFNVFGTSVVGTLTQDHGGGWGFGLSAGSIGLTLGPLSMSATNVAFDPSATGSQPLLSLSSLQVTLALSKVTLTGIAGSNAGNIVISGDGSVSLPNNFSVGVTIGSGTSGGLGWPSWVPIQIQSIILTWPDFSADSSDFTIDLSASVHGQIGPITVTGQVTDVVIDVKKLTSGEFPIVGIGSAAISASGNAFGGTIDGTLILGVIKLDALNHPLPPSATSFDHTIFYAGVDAGFALEGGEAGFHLRFGLSQNGPLEAYIEVDTDVLIVPPAGIAIKKLYGGITFDATPFPSISKATDLALPVFSPGEKLSLSQWELQLQQETVNQSGGGGGGYLFTDSGASADAGGLDAGTITPNLRNTFLNNGDVLSSSSGDGSAIQIVKETAGVEWLIVDGSHYYLVTRDLAGGLVVSQERFVIDSAFTARRARWRPSARLPRL